MMQIYVAFELSMSQLYVWTEHIGLHGHAKKYCVYTQGLGCTDKTYMYINRQGTQRVWQVGLAAFWGTRLRWGLLTLAPIIRVVPGILPLSRLCSLLISSSPRSPSIYLLF